MKVLVTVGSKYGSTREIGTTIAEVLTSQNFDVDFMDAVDVRTVRAYDAVVIGSAIYGGLWRRDASQLAREHAPLLRARQVWAFSVGIAGIEVEGQPRDESDTIAADINARELHRFGGKLNLAKLNVGEKALIRALDPPIGDFRDFTAVRQWAQQIANTLHQNSLT